MKIKHAIAAVFVLFSVRGMAQTDSIFNYHKPLFDFDYSKPVFKLENARRINKNKFLRFSAVSGYREGVDPIIGAYGLNFNSYRDSVAWTQHVCFYNTAMADIFAHGMVKHQMIYLEVKDPSKYLYDPKYGDKQSWMRKNAKCYELMLPLGFIKSAKLLDEFLSLDFGVTFGMGKRLVKSLVLFRTSSIEKFKSAGKGEGKYDMSGHFNNVPIDRLNHPLSEAGLPPMVNETGYIGNIDLDLHLNSWTDLPALRAELRRYDLDLKEEIREVEVFVIRETDYKNN